MFISFSASGLSGRIVDGGGDGGRGEGGGESGVSIKNGYVKSSFMTRVSGQFSLVISLLSKRLFNIPLVWFISFYGDI